MTADFIPGLLAEAEIGSYAGVHDRVAAVRLSHMGGGKVVADLVGREYVFSRRRTVSLRHAVAEGAGIANDPHIEERKTLVDLDDPTTGKKLRLPGVPIRLPGSPGKIRFPGLPFGAANEVVYQDLLGYSARQLEELRSKKVI